MSKIIVKIQGGFGNQLFEYAAGYSCAKKLGFDFYLDKELYDSDKFRDYNLNKFNIIENIATKDIVGNLNKNTLFSHTSFSERHLSFNFKQIKKSAYLRGYFQSEKWFKDYNEEIKKMFTFKDLSFIENKDILADIKNSNSICVHARFGDYVGTKTFDVCKKQYFEDSIEYIKQKVENPKFFIFSDDTKKAKEILGHVDATFVSTSSLLEDFYLMQNCKHSIIPNSSFSWWASYLNTNPNKVIIAPKTWFGDREHDFEDVVPDNWIKIDNKF